MLLARKRFSVTNTLITLLVIVFFFFLSRQVPFNNLSVLMNLALIGVFFFSFKNIGVRIWRLPSYLQLLLVVSLGLLFVDVFYSGLLAKKPSNIFRFFLILFLLHLAYFITLPEKALKYFIFFNVLQCFVIIGISAYLVIFMDPWTYLPVRFYFQDKEWGDIFTYNGWFYLVQVRGNALIPFALFLTFFYEFRYRKIVRGILLLGCFVAGNFAFMLSLMLFFSVLFLRSASIRQLKEKIFMLLIILVVVTGPVYMFYVREVIERKRDNSLATRGDQTRLLMNDMSETPLSLLFGQGLGNTIEKVTSFRDYRGDIYFELQTIYMLNQLGIVTFSLVCIYLVVFSFFNYRDKWLLFIYGCYVVYAVTNPYIFDSSQIAVILILNTLQKYRTENSLLALRKEASLK